MTIFHSPWGLTKIDTLKSVGTLKSGSTLADHLKSPLLIDVSKQGVTQMPVYGLHKWRVMLIAAVVAGLAALAAPARADTVWIGGSGAATALMRLLAAAYEQQHPQEKIIVNAALGSRGGIKALNAGAIDLALIGRPLHEHELAGGLAEIEFARTPLAVAVPAANPVSDITFAQLATHYAGTSAAWPDGNRVRVVLRSRDDTDSRMLASFSPSMAQALDAALARPGMFVAINDEDAAAAIVRLPGAIGTVTLAQIVAGRLPLKALTLAGLPPSVEAIRSGRYPYYKRLFMVTSKLATPTTKRFISFVQSREGARILTAHGCWVGGFTGS